MKMRSAIAALALVAVAPLTAAAQSPIVASLGEIHGVTRTNILAAAEDLSEDLYAYRPTEDVRSMGELFAHIANAQMFFCSTAAGEASPATENFEESRTTKAGIVEALEMAFAYCDGVYAAMTDEAATAERSLPLPGLGPMTGASVLAFNSAHNWEHYGNLVTYMRMNGIVPPTSR